MKVAKINGKYILGLFILSMHVMSCGASDGTQKANNAGGSGTGTGATTGSTTGANFVNQDEQVLGENVTAQVDDAIASAVEENDLTAGSTLSLADGDSDKWDKTDKTDKSVDKSLDMNRFRECVESGNNAVVTIKKSFSSEKTIDRKFMSGSTKASMLDERTRTWSKDGGAIKCADNKKYANIPWSDMKGVTLAVTIKNSASRTSSLTNKKKNTTVATKMARSAEGTRTINWKTVSTTADIITVEKEVTSNVTRKLSATNKAGENKDTTSTVKTADGAPLVISIIRDATTYKVQSRTVKSGKLIATLTDGGRIETTFSNVTYEKGRRCTASSGKITGAIFEKDATTATVTYSVTFDGDDKDIEFSNGKTYELSLDGCDIDQDNASVKESSKKDDIKEAKL